MKLWEPGHGIIMREVWQNKVYSIYTTRVVLDSPTWTALCLPRRTIALYPHTRQGKTIRIPQDDWVLDGGPWDGGDVLYLVHAGVGFTFIGSWDHERNFKGWKIDLVEPPRRTPLGFDYMDQLLDIIVSADRSIWYRKDEDEVSEALVRGLFTDEQVRDLYQRGDRALQMIQGNESPFDVEWETWHPDPDWLVPIDFPQGWDQV